MPKKRSPSQRIGSLGEDRFRLFCHENFLIPNKLENDFGFDFLCQRDLAVDFSATGEVGGVFLGFSVRSTNRPDGRIKLTRSDAECLLTADFPTGIVLIHLDETRSGHTYFRYLDSDLIVQLSTFLASTKKAKHFTPADLQPPQNFRKATARACAPGRLEQDRLEAARQLTTSITGPAEIQVRRDRNSQATLVTAVDFYAYFEQATPAQKQDLYLATFGIPALRAARLRELAINSQIIGGLARLPQPYVLSGFVVDDPTPTHVAGPDARADLDLLRTANDLHHGYVHPAGFALTVSGRVKLGNEHVHHMRALADPDSEERLEDHLDLVTFLDACRPDGAVTFGPGGLTVDLPYFDGLEQCVNFAQAYLAARRLTGWQQTDIKVKDMANLESQRSLLWLACAASGARPPLGLLVGVVEEAQCVRKPATVEIPVICNFTGFGVVTHFTGHGAALFHEDELQGFTVDSYEAPTVGGLPRQPTSGDPEVRVGGSRIVFRDLQFVAGSGDSTGAGELQVRVRLD
ncbi:hypothetical protein ACF1B4_27745 [Streptomyces albidoflavus]